MAHVMMAAGVDATRDIQVELADVVLEIKVIETLLDSVRDRQ